MKNDITPEERDLIRQRTAEAAEFEKLEAAVIVARLHAAAPKLAPLVKRVLTGGVK